MTKINIVKIHGDVPFIHPPLRKPAVERPFLELPLPLPPRDIDGEILRTTPKSSERGVAIIGGGNEKPFGVVDFTV